MTTTRDDRTSAPPTTPRRSPLQRLLFVALALWVVTIPIFWFLQTELGVGQKLASNTMVLIHVAIFATALALPWLVQRGPGGLTTSQRLDGTIIVWLFICLAPRFIWELPWLLFLDEIRAGVADEKLWTYFWSPYLQGGDARYLNGDPLVVTLECIALFVGIFELYALVQFFRQGRRFTPTQLAFIMAGMIVEVTLPAVYFGTEIANDLENVASLTDLLVKFVLLNAFWCTLPLVTFAWAARRLNRNDLDATF